MARRNTPPLPTIPDYARLVEEIERGRPPADAPDRRAAIRCAIDRICVADWQTPAKREQAQSLVARLVRLQLSWGGQAKNGQARPADGRQPLTPAYG
jgi:hypothetical protein